MSSAFEAALARLPEQLRGQIAGWVHEGRQTGRFMEAVIANDLLSAVTRADDECLSLLLDIVRFMHNEVPSECWGSPALADRWRLLGGLDGCTRRAAAEPGTRAA